MDSADAFGLSPKIEAVEDVVAALDLVEPDQRLELLRDSLKKYGTVIHTVVPGAALSGVLRRRFFQSPTQS